MNIVLVHLTLLSPSNPDDLAKGLEVSLCFNDQPSTDDVFRAFQEVPSVNRHKDFEAYRQRLFECLETYGVPQLDKFRMVSSEGTPIGVPMVYATWHLNLVSNSAAASGVRIGDLRICRRRVHNVECAHDLKPDPSLEETGLPAVPTQQKTQDTPVRRARPQRKN